MTDLIQRLRTTRRFGPEDFEMLRNAADQLEANSAHIALLRASLRKVEDEVEALKHDIASALDSLAKESVARCEAEDEVEGLKGPQHWNPVYNTDPVQRACGELPEGFEVEILLEQGAGCVYLVNNNCGERISIDNTDKFDWTIHEAIDAALSAATGEKKP